MPPKDFIRARESDQERVMVDGQPYWPKVYAAPKGPTRDVAMAVVTVLDLDKSTVDSLTVEPVVGGLSNTLFRVSGLPPPPTLAAGHDNNKTQQKQRQQNGNKHMECVLVRIFGAEGMIDRDVETSTFSALAREGIAPPYYGRFANGRLEGWMQGMRPLQVPELGRNPIIQAVAQQVALLHTQFQIPADLQEYYTTPNMWQQLEEWLAQALQNTYQTDHDVQRAASLHLSTVADEFTWLRQAVLPADAAVVYCHNDVLAANILYDDDTGSMQLIDFEYGGCNYATFDLANHWNEYAGGPPNETIPRYDWLPRVTQQTLFCRTYLETAAAAAAQSSKCNNSTPITDAQVEQFRQQVQAFLLPNHLYWGLWAINQAATEGCQDYDYMRYGMERFRQYNICKQDWLALASSQY